MKILITGASGFIGSAFIRKALIDTDYTFRALVRNTNQRNLLRLFHYKHVLDAQESGRLHVVYGDLLGDISSICEDCDYVINFAAKSFVDHSIKDPLPFIESNVIGTYKLLEDAKRNKIKRFIQISTDEVYGAILEGAYTEDSRLNPTNPYAATKAGGDALAIAYAHTFGLHTTITRTENNYGIMQHKQKALPVFVRLAMKGEPLTVFGDGLHSRQWLAVDDNVDALIMLLRTETMPGEVFHVAGRQELTNLSLAKKIISLCNKEFTNKSIKFIPDHDARPGHDRRYALTCDKMKKLGWEPKINLDRGLELTVNWYRENTWWIE